MKQVTISSKNQITLPSEILRQHRLAPGKKLYITIEGGNIILTTKSSLRRFLDYAESVHGTSTSNPSKNIVDPIAERRQLNNEWEDQENQ
jgi:AbrB family looped-hinge helix DNA binding protein